MSKIDIEYLKSTPGNNDPKKGTLNYRVGDFHPQAQIRSPCSQKSIFLKLTSSYSLIEI